MRFQAERIYIRAWTVEDAALLQGFQIGNREEIEGITAAERDEAFYTLEGQTRLIEKWLEQKKEGKRYSFGIFLQDTDELVGEISLFRIELNDAEKWVLGYATDRLHHGKGYMSEALKCVLLFAKDEMKIMQIEAGAVPDNAGSIRVLLKAGFQESGTHDVPIQGVLKKHTMFTISLNDGGKQRAPE
ncbi:GNAT family N-acetyltransferase [Paenibacillus sp. 2TAF8]|jgi:ribosomal-protein-alanine N-acetyltransferase|uniref:GNAT family N-acetyltransferase n=1 Tax=Paenibacillus sp. 2TAF8 TaxID=3233020 RepID=UPI003F9AF9EF